MVKSCVMKKKYQAQIMPSLNLSNVDFGHYSDGCPIGNIRFSKLRIRPNKPSIDTMSLLILTEDLGGVVSGRTYPQTYLELSAF